MISVFGSKNTQDEIDAVTECLQSNWTGIGSRVDEFEATFKKRLSVSNYLMVDNCSNALYLAIKSLNLPAGSEVILPSFTWLSCAQAVLLNGLTPRFCDVNVYTQNVTEQDIAAAITSKTSAIMVVYYAGLPVFDINKIVALGFPVIEDAAHAVDAKIGEQYCGTFGDIGCWSFDSVKNLAVGEGGGMYFKNNELYEKSRMMRYCGIGFSGFKASQSKEGARWWEYDIQEPNIKMLPTDISAAIGLAQLKNLPANQARRKQIWEYYNEQLAELPVHLPLPVPRGQTHGYFTYFIHDIQKRDELAVYLKQNGIYTTLRYHPLHMNKIYGCDYNLPNSEYLNMTGLNIPLHPNLADNDIQKIINSIKTFFK